MNDNNKCKVIKGQYRHAIFNYVRLILLFIPCMIGKIFLKLCWFVPQFKNKNQNEKIESQKLYITGFNFFLVINLYLLLLFGFIKLISNNLFFFKILYYKFSVFLFSFMINTVLFFLLKILSSNLNIKNIQRKLEADERIINFLKPNFSAVAGTLLLFSFINSVIMQYFAGVNDLSLYTVIALITFYAFPPMIITLLFSSIITNKRIITVRFLKSLENLSFSNEKLREIMKQDKKVGCIPLFLSKQDILISDIIKFSEIKLRCAFGSTLLLNNGLVFRFNSENRIEVQNEIEKIIEENK